MHFDKNYQYNNIIVFLEFFYDRYQVYRHDFDLSSSGLDKLTWTAFFVFFIAVFI